MGDPSEKVEGSLLEHLHLVVSQNTPLQPQQFADEVVLQQLLRAPQLIRNKPVSWQYWHAPPNGSTYIAWQPAQLGSLFASDGYVWSGPEQVYSKEIRGHTLQIFVAESGYSPTTEHFTIHRRMRYKIVNSTNGQHDQALELVQYTAAFEKHIFPAQSIPQTAQTQKSMMERNYLEKQGGLPRKEFMLLDRQNHPSITMPGNPISANPYQSANPYGRGGIPRQSSQVTGMRGMQSGPSPGKRPMAGGHRMPGGPMGNPFPTAAQPVSESMLDEDNHFYGDALDLLTPKELSAARYKQHHEWMAEIVSSPYDTWQILPVNLGLRFQGELGQLMDGLWEDQALVKEVKDPKDDPSLDKDTLQKLSGYGGGLTPENVQILEKRVEDFVKKTRDELAEMKRAHQGQMDEMSKQKLFSNLERRLAEKGDSERVAEVTREVEPATGLQVVECEPVKQIRRGGYLERSTENSHVDGRGDAAAAAPVTLADPASQLDDLQEFADFTEMDTAGEALDQWIDYNKY